MRSLLVCTVFCLVQLAGGCASPGTVDKNAGPAANWYGSGDPFFDIQPVATLLSQGSGVDVFVQLLPGGCTFVRSGSGYLAAIDMSIRIHAQESDSLVTERTWPESLRVSSYGETKAAGWPAFEKSFPVSPGKYMVEVSIEDRNSERSAVRRDLAVIPAMNKGEPFISIPVLFRRAGDGTLKPCIPFHLPSSDDTLYACARIFNAPRTTLGAELLLTRLGVDTMAATPPYAYSSSFGTLNARYVNPGHLDTVYHKRYEYSAESAAEELRLRLPPLDRGVFRAQIRVNSPPSAQEPWTISAGRYFAVMGPSFPRVATLAEMIQALKYLAKEHELDSTAAADSPAQQRRRFEAFWLSFLPDKRRAAETMKIYARRIEEANLLFSTYKEGWKTDRGMVYTIMGPPDRVERTMGGQTWYYAAAENRTAGTWQFHNVDFAPEHFSVTDFVLVRTASYARVWMAMIAKWRDGEIY